VFPSCNLSGDVWFEADGTPAKLRERIEAHLGVTFEDTATETGEYSYRSYVFGFVILLRITPKWGAGILCRFLGGTDRKLGIYDFDAPDIPFGRHLARLVEVYELGQMISHDEVKRRWEEEHR
jgi:hypothetical protein